MNSKGSTLGRSPTLIRIANLEINLSHGCNFSCESCSHYSNQGINGLVSIEEAGRWMDLWKRRINPQIFSLVGGEPTLHPNVAEFVDLSRRNWPEAHLRIVTNGSFLHRHPELPLVLQKDPNACIYLSIHHDAPEYRERLQPVLELMKNWIHEYGIRVAVYESFRNWTRRYKGFGSSMEPFDDGQPGRSWRGCPARCLQLFEGKIWKCGPLAYLKLQDAKHGLSEKWRPYLAYRPLQSDCTDEELIEFLKREEEPYCGMCPADREKFKPPLPFVPKGFPYSHHPSENPVKGLQPGVIHAMRMQNPLELLASWIYKIELPPGHEDPKEWRPYPLFRGRSRQLEDFGCHFSVLSPGSIPHPPHEHAEEEILIMLSGEADLLIGMGGSSPSLIRHRLRPGSFVYYPAYQPHTLHNSGPQETVYLMFKWRSSLNNNAKSLPAVPVQFLSGETLPDNPSGRIFFAKRVLEGNTRYLRKLHSHVTTLLPGGGYHPHADPYDVAILMLQGTVESLGRRVDPLSIIYYASGDQHGIRNVGVTPAVYLVFEFHGTDSS